MCVLFVVHVLFMCTYIYVRIYIYVYVYIHVYIYMYLMNILNAALQQSSVAFSCRLRGPPLRCNGALIGLRNREPQKCSGHSSIITTQVGIFFSQPHYILGALYSGVPNLFPLR